MKNDDDISNYIIKIPVPKALVERQQAAIEAAGVSADECKVLEVFHDPIAGRSRVLVEASPEFLTELVRAGSIRLHDPKKSSDITITAKGKDFEIVVIKEATKEEAKNWVLSEKKRRSKSKSEKGNFPTG